MVPDSAKADPAPLLSIQLEPQAFEPLAALSHWHDELVATLGALPAAESHFLGRVRPHTASGEALAALELEHYPGMTEARLGELAAATAGHHRARAVLVRHRVGRVLPGEVIVLVATVADRRGPAQQACLELLEALKHEAPFWKREWGTDGEGIWLSGNTPL